MNDLGVETAWVVIEGSDRFFNVTKAVHNALQGAETQIDDEMRETYWERMHANAAELPEDFDVILVHDPQPAAMLQVLEESARRKGRWIWRCHIDLSAPYRPVWDFFEPIVNRYDAAIFTAEEYVQPGVQGPDPGVHPALDRPAQPEERADDGVDVARRPHAVRRRSRPSARHPGLAVRSVEGPARRHRCLPVGPARGPRASSWRWSDRSPHDDPEGIRYLDLTTEHAAGDPDIHLLTNLSGVGDSAVNAFQRASDVIVQKSLREGFGLVVAEGMWKWKPVVGGDVGGIRLQIEDGVTGYLVDGIGRCAERVTELLRHPEKRKEMGEAGRGRVRERFLCLREIEDTLRLISRLTA